MSFSEKETVQERLFERIVVGELGEDSREAAALFVDRPDLKARLQRMRRITSSLDTMAKDEEHAIETLAAETSRPGDARLADRMRDLLESGGTGDISPAAAGDISKPRRWAMPLAAAAALLLAAGAAQVSGLFSGLSGEPSSQDPTAPEEETIFLSGEGGEEVALSPSGDSAAFEKFTWSGHLESGESWQVLVYDGGEEASFEPRLRSQRLYKNEWAPNSDQIDSMAVEIRWEVQRIPASGGTGEIHAEAAARRLP